MTTNSPHRTAILPVSDSEPRPRWSVMIPTYNCADYLRETLASVLTQDPGPDVMQIEVVDDNSTADDPRAVVEALGQGRVGFFRQPHNVGHTRNFDTCLQRARGHFVHLLHGDDAVRPGFYETMGRPFDAHSELGAAFCRDIRMDEQGNWLSISRLLQPQSGILDNWLKRIGAGQRLQAPAMVVRRSVYERLGGFDRRIRAYGEDWEMWVRIAAHYPVWYEVEPLAIYRLRTASLSGRAVRAGQTGSDMRRAIEIVGECMPPTERKDTVRGARQAFALACLRRAHRLLEAGEPLAAWYQSREAVRSYPSPVTVHGALFVAARIARHKLLPGKI